MKPTHDTNPTPEEIREALRRILASRAFIHAPQLGAFLRFVVESALAGEGDHIKSYTIAVEALGRGESFDPATDPIVRVEAGRLRRALARYYADADTQPVTIELPLGTYVPTFQRSKLNSGARDAIKSLRRVMSTPWSRGTAFALVCAIVACSALVVTWAWRGADGIAKAGPPNLYLLTSRSVVQDPSGPILPIVFVQPFEAVGVSAPQLAELELFRGKLRDALAHFDEIEVASEAVPPVRPASRSAYRLAASASFHDDGSFSLSLWLGDIDEGTIVWTQSFELGPSDIRAALSDIVQRVAPKLAQPYGVIYARELADGRTDPRYRCLMAAFEYRRGFDRSIGLEVLSCMEQVTALNPGFADGFAVLSLLVLRQYYEGEADRAAKLERALTLAQRAVDLKPQSARARQALLSALFARGEITAGLAEGRAAITANPYDMLVLHGYGVRLVRSGQIDEGAPLVRKAAALTPVRPASFEFALFLCAYVLGDDKGAANQARLFTNNDHPLVLLARAIATAKAGEREEARLAIDRLFALHPGWRDNLRQRLERYVAWPDIVERMMRDLATAGLSVAG